MLSAFESASAPRLLLVGRPMPDGTQVLVPQVIRPRTCRRLDGVKKISYATRAQAKAARTKHDEIYRCPNCGAFHLATKHRREARPALSDARPRAAA